MPDGRLHLLDARIQKELAVASPERSRRIAIEVSALALDSIADHPALLDQAVAVLRGGSRDPAMAERVGALATELDDRYLSLHDNPTPGASSEDWLEAFRLARAASALTYAYGPDSKTAAAEAAYEALAATDENVEALAAVVTGTQ